MLIFVISWMEFYPSPWRYIWWEIFKMLHHRLMYVSKCENIDIINYCTTKQVCMIFSHDYIYRVCLLLLNILHTRIMNHHQCHDEHTNRRSILFIKILLWLNENPCLSEEWQAMLRLIKLLACVEIHQSHQGHLTSSMQATVP